MAATKGKVANHVPDSGVPCTRMWQVARSAAFDKCDRGALQGKAANHVPDSGVPCTRMWQVARSAADEQKKKRP